MMLSEWLEGWIGEWMDDGWMTDGGAVSVAGWMGSWLGRRMAGWVESWVDKWMDRRTDR